MTENIKWREKGKQRKITKILRVQRIKAHIHSKSGAHLRKEKHLNLQSYRNMSEEEEYGIQN